MYFEVYFDNDECFIVENTDRVYRKHIAVDEKIAVK